MVDKVYLYLYGSMFIAKTASRNIAFKADMMSQAVLEAQASFVTPSS